MPAEIPTTPILGIPVARLTLDEARDEVGRLLDGPGPALVCYVNAHSANVAAAEPEYRRVLQSADLVLNDGSGVALAARLAGAPFPANLNGTDFTPDVLRLSTNRGLSVFFLGGPEDLGGRAAASLESRIPGLRFAGSLPGFFPASDGPAVAEEIKRSGADVLVVGMGNPRQELWLARHLPATGVRLGIAVGAFLDFASERVPRAPAWMRTAGIEWIFRLSREPRRLFRRYVLGNPLFLLRVLRDRLATRRGHPNAPGQPRAASRPRSEHGGSRGSTAQPLEPELDRQPRPPLGACGREDI
ncbi:WecB/TagA/CpsF family glycosyltransferase [Actinoalloteichus hymeniacidonis]|uniref:Exopolysaccharide biosynthesis protein, WecB/TagA/CpsF family n=1 Tax=Actinoalloteichus hymeniacidonis TaxID=340345 RepID=A0AAC9N1I3_9PSEU|nr:WecB/TagA/CpsF family glycosyltransferase [Actinoalloteichus hymeniacidonis]AOS65896.1 exopolysaccharide biosynthesis protein, WecB/TagA/CpsF family [Actinoalloteichus hymeniacidonis]MBB5906008.1 N-acetylglucosaminyldiphosphoundecaprenol N-acetyl-beta-D-mannosaminyltransferase [Actinoalloteichus hymeniacidonis]